MILDLSTIYQRAAHFGNSLTLMADVAHNVSLIRLVELVKLDNNAVSAEQLQALTEQFEAWMVHPTFTADISAFIAEG